MSSYIRMLLVLLVCWSTVHSLGQQEQEQELPLRLSTTPQPTLNCAEAVAAEIKEHGGDPPADYEYMACDEDGNYQPKQCFGEWTGAGWCSCVDVITGETLRDIKGNYAYSMEGWASKCACAAVKKTTAERAKDCELATGDYKPVSCTGERCRCVDRSGSPMTQYQEFDKGASNCRCARESADISIYTSPTFRCDAYGKFEPQQCCGTECFCVDHWGSLVDGPVKIGSYEYHRLRC